MAKETIHVALYKNRKLYIQAAVAGVHRYQTLADLAALVRAGHDIIVTRKADGADVTGKILASILVDEPTAEVGPLYDAIRGRQQPVPVALPTFASMVRATQVGDVPVVAQSLCGND